MLTGNLFSVSDVVAHRKAMFLKDIWLRNGRLEKTRTIKGESKCVQSINVSGKKFCCSKVALHKLICLKAKQLD